MSEPRILTIDIETMPALVYTFSLRTNYIPIEAVKEPDRMASYAAKWLNSPKIAFASEYHHDRETMLHSCFSLLDEADAVVTFNGDNFDIPWMQREFTLAGLGQPSPFVSVDLYKTAKKNFRFLSNKLAYLTEQFELTGKLTHTGFRMWRECLGDFGPEAQKKAWNLMRRYNKQDTLTTEEFYLELRPYLNQKLNFGLFAESGDTVCPRCGGADLERRGYAHTPVSTFQQYRCRTCGAWPRGGKREAGVDLR